MKENRHFLVQHQGQPDQGRREADAHAELSHTHLTLLLPYSWS